MAPCTTSAACIAGRADIVAGLSTLVLLVPQSMAYAALAGLPPASGLYAAFVAPLAYAAVGRSRRLAVGPVAVDSLLTAATVGALAQVGSGQYLSLVALLALCVGALQMLLAALGAGFFVNFLSKPVVSGFVSAAALIIAISQLGTLLGVPVPSSPSMIEVLSSTLVQLERLHAATFAVGAGSLILLWALKRWLPRWPRALLVVAGAALSVWGLGLEAAGVAVVGDVPDGLPWPSLPEVSFSRVAGLAPGALSLAFVGFLEATSVSTRLREAGQRRLEPDRELFALGLANLTSGLFRGLPVAGGFSRSALNAECGATSRLAGVVAAMGVGLTLLFLTPLLHFVPRSALAALIIFAVGALIDLAEPKRLYKVKPADLGMLAATFVFTLALGVTYGVLAGVGLSLLVFVARTTRPHVAVLGRLPGTEVYKSVTRYPEAITNPGALVLRLDAQLYFGNVNFLVDCLERLEAQMTGPLGAVVLDASGINQLDSSAESALRELIQTYEQRGILLVLAEAKGPVRDVLEKSGLSDRLGSDGLAPRVHDAVMKVNAALHGD